MPDRDENERTAAYRRDIRRVFQSMSDNALHFQNARIPWTDCVDRQEIDREYDRRATASGTGDH